MLAKVIDLRKQFTSADAGIEYVLEGGQDLEPVAVDSPAGAGVEYVARAGVVEVGSLNLGGIDPRDPVERKLARDLIDACARQGLANARTEKARAISPVYHVVLSWPPGEVPTKEQAEQAAQKALEAVGLGTAQALYAVHRDKDHHHVHVLANKHAAISHKMLGPARYDYLLLDRACREIELAQGWSHSPGPHVVVDGRVVHMSRAQRRRAGLLRDDPAGGDGKKLSVRSGLPTLSDYLRASVPARGFANWQEFHAALARAGVQAQIGASKSGSRVLMFVAAGGDGGNARVIASSVNRAFSLSQLEKRFGPFAPARENVPAQKTFAAWLDDVAAGREPAAGEIPGTTGGKRDTEKRAAARVQRAYERALLLERWKTEKVTARDEMRDARAQLKARHVADRKALGRPPRGESAEARLAAAQYVAAREALRARHKIERAALEKKLDMSWRAWLERQAVLGDQTAASALRGITYREQREQNKARAGFEGEDLRLGDAGDGGRAERGGAAGGIGGEERRWTFADARIEIDNITQVVRYLDDSGAVRVIDAGQRIDLANPADEDAMRAGMLLAAQRYGGQIYITGDAEFRERAARLAAQLGIDVVDPDLKSIVEHEREAMRMRRGRGVER